MNPLQSRKQLLIVESELNRAQLGQEWQSLRNEAGAIAGQAASFDTMARSVFSLAGALGAFTGSSPKPAAAASSWLQKITSGVKLASTVWAMFRPPDADAERE